MRKDLDKFFGKKQKFVDQVVRVIESNGKVDHVNLKQEAEYWNKVIQIVRALDGKCICGRSKLSLNFLKNGTFGWALCTLCIDEGRYPFNHAGRNKFYDHDPEVVVNKIIKKLVAENRMTDYVPLF